MDLTKVFIAIIDLCAALVTAFLIPWLKSNYDEKQRAKLTAAIDVGVYAAQQLFTHEQCEEKLAYVKDYLQRKGYDANTDEIRTQIEAAVKMLKATIGE